MCLFKLRYEAGDHVAIYPSNDSELVNKIGELLNVDLDMTVSLENLEGLFNLYSYVYQI